MIYFSLRYLFAVGVLSVMVLTPRAGYSTRIINSPTGLSIPVVTTITFSEVSIPNNTAVTNQFASLGVTFSPQLVYNPQTTLGFGFDQLGNFFTGGAGGFIGPFSIIFNTPLTGAAFQMVTNTTVSTFGAELMLAGTMVDTFTATTTVSTTNSFYGFENIVFDEIVIAPGGSNAGMLLDNLQLGAPIPEPSTMLLLGSGLAGLGFFRWRRKDRKNPSIA